MRPLKVKTLEFDAECRRPGAEGVFWRLVREWPPGGIAKWVAEENARRTEAMLLGPAFGRHLAGSAMLFATFFSDRDAVLTNEATGVCRAFSRSLERMATARGYDKTAGGIIIPPSGGVN